jgi:hypothetical protein
VQELHPYPTLLAHARRPPARRESRRRAYAALNARVLASATRRQTAVHALLPRRSQGNDVTQPDEECGGRFGCVKGNRAATLIWWGVDGDARDCGEAAVARVRARRVAVVREARWDDENAMVPAPIAFDRGTRGARRHLETARRRAPIVCSHQPPAGGSALTRRARAPAREERWPRPR